MRALLRMAPLARPSNSSGRRGTSTRPIQSETTLSTYSTAGGGSWTAGSATDLYYLTDANNNVTAVTDSSGNVLERYDYDAYGHVTVYTPTWTGTGSLSAVGNDRFFAGMQLDPVTGIYYDGDRWYNSSTGGFETRDPAQSDPNLYRYCGNDPTGAVDPSGMVAYIPAAAVAWTLMGGEPAAPGTPGPNGGCGPRQGPGNVKVPNGYGALGGGSLTGVLNSA